MHRKLGSMIPDNFRRIWRSRWMSKVLLLLSVTGFTWQIVVVSIEYFAYKTTTAVSFQLLPYIKPRIAVLCFRYQDVMQWKPMDRETGSRYGRSQKSGSMGQEEIRLTIEQIFKYTPDVDQVMDRCLVRNKDGTVSDSREECEENFSIEKYFKQQEICYQIQRKQKDDLLLEEVTHSSIKSFLVYEIQLTKWFKEAAVLEAIIFQEKGGGYPFLSRDYAVKHWIKHQGRDNSTQQRYLHLSGSDIDIERMPKPYDTQCIEVDDNVGYDCLLSCKLDYYKDIDRVPASELLFQPYNLTPVSDTDKKDHLIRQKVQLIETLCRDECHMHASWCKVHISITHLEASFHFNDSIMFSVNTGKQPDLSSRSIPVSTFIEYFSFTAGCFGIWFGLSFLSLHPGRFIRMCDRKRRITRRWIMTTSREVVT